MAQDARGAEPPSPALSPCPHWAPQPPHRAPPAQARTVALSGLPSPPSLHLSAPVGGSGLPGPPAPRGATETTQHPLNLQTHGLDGEMTQTQQTWVLGGQFQPHCWEHRSTHILIQPEVIKALIKLNIVSFYVHLSFKLPRLNSSERIC